ncbi:MAG: indole-3-glycerol-phosphate synthase [Acidimicrobiia bacterium]
MSGFLAEMERSSRERVHEAQATVSLRELEERSASMPAPVPLSAFGEVFDLIAEFKPRSPAAGDLPRRDGSSLARAYETGGAGMISVLTEPTRFGGSLENLSVARASTRVPILAKDFLVDPYQVHLARSVGADGVLLIARMLGRDRLSAMLDAVDGTGMFALVEGFDAADLGVMAEVVVDRPNVLFGINCRDLMTLDVVPQRLAELAHLVPGGLIGVAESSIGGPDDAAWVAGLGYRAALVGSALMSSDEPASLVSAMVRLGREAAGVRAR